MAMVRHELLRKYIAEVIVSSSDDYMRKEAVRQHLQDHIVSLVRDGEIVTEDDLGDFFATLDMAARALGNVPFDVWRKMAGM